MDLIYARGRRFTPEEVEVQAQGWKWVNTNTINPTHTTSNNGLPDRLGAHSHHGESTHRVICGDLCIKREQGDYGIYEISRAPGSEQQDRVKPKVKYSATSKEGCMFVEGHKCLSPESAVRFLARGTLEVTDKKRRSYFPDGQALQTWLGQVRFNPNGKAHPNLSKGEKSILDTNRVRTPIPEDVKTDILEWFENEWHGPKRRTGMELATWALIAIMIAILCYTIAES
ncbi:hypothetical protein O1611_g3666 [Lasiodiplodia mahajangana]|uniref:Uncharacterized protein n=1 Tax=Lasiodiplodia mahajangana TaxID=1108764 RepID=A0ACC2JR39_9PEZI|nr:hypothetical protein O1611_g3666 [Lasiodiplodia mahajangana]